MSTIYHIVHFWLKPDLPAERRDAFAEALRQLEQSPHVRRCRVGQPVAQPPDRKRAVVDDSYDYQLFAEFDTQAAADAYQDPSDAVHTAFLDEFKTDWTRVLVYDSVESA